MKKDSSKHFFKAVIGSLKNRRIEMGLTQSALAKTLDVSQITYSHMESGRRRLTLYEFALLSQALNFPSDRILKEAVGPIPLRPAKRKQKVISFTSFKGGVGGSSLAILLANELSKNYKTLLVDADFQATCDNLRNRDLEKNPNVQVPYSIKKVTISNALNFTTDVKDDYDYTIIDLPRVFYEGEKVRSVLNISDFIFSPFHLSVRNSSFSKLPNPFDYVDGRLDLFIDQVSKIISRAKDINVVLVPYRDKVSKRFHEYLESYGIVVLPKSFKIHAEIPKVLNTFEPFSNYNHEIQPPFIRDTLDVLYYLKDFVSR